MPEKEHMEADIKSLDLGNLEYGYFGTWISKTWNLEQGTFQNSTWKIWNLEKSQVKRSPG